MRKNSVDDNAQTYSQDNLSGTNFLPPNKQIKINIDR